MSVLPLEPTPVTLDDLEAVFRLISGIDGHPRGEMDIDAWLLVAQAARWTRAEVAAASLTLATTWTGFRIMPGHVTAQINADRERIRQAWYCPDPPRELRDDPAAEIAWRRRAARDFTDRALLALATGHQLAEVPMLREVEQEPAISLSSAEQTRRLGEATGRVGARKAISAGPSDGRARSVPARRERRPLDEDTRRAVREELAARVAASAGEDVRGAVRAESAARAAASAVVDHEVAV